MLFESAPVFPVIEQAKTIMLFPQGLEGGGWEGGGREGEGEGGGRGDSHMKRLGMLTKNFSFGP